MGGVGTGVSGEEGRELFTSVLTLESLRGSCNCSTSSLSSLTHSSRRLLTGGKHGTVLCAGQVQPLQV